MESPDFSLWNIYGSLAVSFMLTFSSIREETLEETAERKQCRRCVCVTGACSQLQEQKESPHPQGACLPPPDLKERQWGMAHSGKWILTMSFLYLCLPLTLTPPRDTSRQGSNNEKLPPWKSLVKSANKIKREWASCFSKWHLCITTLGPLLHPQTLSPSSIFYSHPSIASQSQE